MDLHIREHDDDINIEELVDKIAESVELFTEALNRFTETINTAMQPALEMLSEWYENILRAQFQSYLLDRGFPAWLAMFIAAHWPYRFLPDLDIEEEEGGDG